jgi:hypothetical protein
MLSLILTAASVLVVTATPAANQVAKSEMLKPRWWQGDDFSWVRGANYISGFAYNSFAQWDKYDPQAVDRELAYATKLQLNSVRVWMNAVVYQKDPQRYMANLEDLLTRCERYGLTAMLILFDGCFGESDPDFDTRAWIPNPGPTLMLPENREKLRPYIDDVVKTYRGDPRISMWDIMNEPSSMGVPKIASGNDQFAWDFARYWADYVREIDRTHPTTIGVGNHAHIPWVYDHVDVVTFHCYQAFEKTYRMEIAAARELAKDKAVIITETSTNEMGSTPELNFRILGEERIGWYFFSLILGECPVTQPGGVCTTDGTVPFPDYVSAVLGFSTPQEAMLPRLDRFRMVDILQNTDTRPTTPENFEPRRTALFETGRCLVWAGVKMEGNLQKAVTELTAAVEQHNGGKLDEACRSMDNGIKLMDAVVRATGIYDELYVPTIKR